MISNTLAQVQRDIACLLRNRKQKYGRVWGGYIFVGESICLSIDSEKIDRISSQPAEIWRVKLSTWAMTVHSVNNFLVQSHSNRQFSCTRSTGVCTRIHCTLLTRFVSWQMSRRVSDSVPVPSPHWLSAAPSTCYWWPSFPGRHCSCLE